MLRSQLRPAILTLDPVHADHRVSLPLAVTGIAQLVFPHQANGSLIVRNGKATGSSLIGQSFDDPKYFWGRLSATGGFPYNAAAFLRFKLGAAQSRPPRRGPSTDHSSACGRPWQYPTHPGGSGHGIGERFGSRHFDRRGALSGAACGAGAWNDRGRRDRPRQ